MLNLKIIIASTRPGRKGPVMAEWIYNKAKEFSQFDTELVDLAEVNLPMMDEPNHPRLQKYEKEHTRKWSALIDASDAFIFVLPEYNYSYPATIKNALDYLFVEWAKKPVAFLSYGGLSAGTRSVQALKQVVSALSMVPLVEGINIPFFPNYIDEHGKFKPTEVMEKGAEVMLTELTKWGETLKQMRGK